MRGAVGGGVLSVLGIDADDVLALIKDGMWEPDWYTAHYPDVQASGEEPLLHYLAHGWRELRSPSSGFDARWYCETYGISGADTHAAIHFLRYGRRAGLRPQPDGSDDA